ncbi:MAG: ABC transporter permease [Olsenella sp.]|nr:ABC transporter permease [Olsenella sp.]
MSPINKRLPRELRHNLGRYLGLFVLIALTIAMVSGYLVAAKSIERRIAETREEVTLEDFGFATQFKASDAAIRAVEDLSSGSVVHENFYSDVSLALSGDGAACTARLYKNRVDFNQAIYYTGHAPEAEGEIALDKTFSANHGLSVGSTVTVAGRRMTVSGIMVLTDYEALIKKNTDLIFDAQTFTVAQVTDTAFDELAAGTIYNYAVVLGGADADMSLADRTDLERDAADALAKGGAKVVDLVDRESNNSMTYADDDIEGDQVGWVVICAILLVVCAFVFVVLTNATIEEESATIGTLLASGYRKGELIRHYLAAPTIVGVLAAAVGNAVGYGAVVDLMSGLYYRSYSLPPYRTYFSGEVFAMTTVVPVVMLVAITFLGIARKLSATPLAFLRREVGRRSHRSSLALPERWGFVTRFRSRVFLRNASHFAVLFVGIMFSSLLLLFGLCMLPLIRHYAGQMADSVPAEHVYMLKAPLEIDVNAAERGWAVAADRLLDFERPADELSREDYLDLVGRAAMLQGDERVRQGHVLNTKTNPEHVVEDAEKFVATTLDVARLRSEKSEQVTVYGVKTGSKYFKYDVSGGKIVIGAGLAKKCGLAPGRQATFTDRYTGDTYVLAPDVVAGEPTDMNVYMSRATYAEVFGEDVDYFNGYVSNEPLRLNDRYVASEMTPGQMVEIANQMEDSMGSIMSMIMWLAVPISIVLIYLLTKTVIDRSARYISYMKVFGYRNKEVTNLYVRSITITVLASLVLSLPLVYWLVSLLMEVVMADYAGNIELWVPWYLLLEVIGIGAVAYALVAVVHVWHIRRISLSDAMKVQE